MEAVKRQDADYLDQALGEHFVRLLGELGQRSVPGKSGSSQSPGPECKTPARFV